jgi:hypothetical protein
MFFGGGKLSNLFYMSFLGNTHLRIILAAVVESNSTGATTGKIRHLVKQKSHKHIMTFTRNTDTNTTNYPYVSESTTINAFRFQGSLIWFLARTQAEHLTMTE